MDKQKKNYGNIIFIVSAIVFIFIFLYRFVGSFFDLPDWAYWDEYYWGSLYVYFFNGVLFLLSSFFMFLLSEKPPMLYYYLMFTAACIFPPFTLFDPSLTDVFIYYFKHMWIYPISPTIGFALGFILASIVKKIRKAIKKK